MFARFGVISIVGVTVGNPTDSVHMCTNSRSLIRQERVGTYAGPTLVLTSNAFILPSLASPKYPGRAPGVTSHSSPLGTIVGKPLLLCLSAFDVQYSV